MQEGAAAGSHPTYQRSSSKQLTCKPAIKEDAAASQPARRAAAGSQLTYQMSSSQPDGQHRAASQPTR